MKKIIAFLLFLVMLASVSFAEDVDLTKYTDEELNLLIQRINLELGSRKGTEYWFDYGVGQEIPKIELISGDEPILDDYVLNSEHTMSVTVRNATDDDFLNYVTKLQMFGFIEDVDRSNISFSAKNGQGISLWVTNYGKSGIMISVSADWFR